MKVKFIFDNGEERLCTEVDHYIVSEHMVEVYYQRGTRESFSTSNLKSIELNRFNLF